MHISGSKEMSYWRVTVAVCVATIMGACSVDKQSAPSLSGPSGFGKALIVTATPDTLARDGSSQAVVRINYSDGSTNEPLAQQRLLVSVSEGSLSATEVVTDQTGNASVTFIAPSLNTPVTSVTVAVTPVGDNAANTVSRPILIRVIGPEFPSPTFEFSPANPLQFEQVTFNASGTTLSGSPCPECTYSWNFGDGEGGGSERIAEHVFDKKGNYLVTLTVSTPAGTSNSTTRMVTVGAPAAPTASFTFSPTNPEVGDQVFFNASSSTAKNGASIVSYRWDFGNGSSPVVLTTPTTQTSFASARTWRVTLTVVDSNGETATVEQSVSVDEP